MISEQLAHDLLDDRPPREGIDDDVDEAVEPTASHALQNNVSAQSQNLMNTKAALSIHRDAQAWSSFLKKDV